MSDYFPKKSINLEIQGTNGKANQKGKVKLWIHPGADLCSKSSKFCILRATLKFKQKKKKR